MYRQEFVVIRNVDNIGQVLILLSGLNVFKDVAVELVKVYAGGLPGGPEDLFDGEGRIGRCLLFSIDLIVNYCVKGGFEILVPFFCRKAVAGVNVDILLGIEMFGAVLRNQENWSADKPAIASIFCNGLGDLASGVRLSSMKNSMESAMLSSLAPGKQMLQTGRGGCLSTFYCVATSLRQRDQSDSV